MTAGQVRKWLGLYFVLCTSLMGGFMLLFSETPLLPVRRAEGIDAFSILVPVLLGQLALVSQWYSRVQDMSGETGGEVIPAWIVKAPAVASLVLFVACAALMAIGNGLGSQTWTPSPGTFKVVVVFCVSILNASTVFIVGRFFPVGGQ